MESNAVPIIAAIASLVFFALAMGGAIWLLVVAFKENVWWGLGCMFVPGVSLVFVIMFWKKAWKPFVLQLACVIPMMLTMGAMMIPALSAVQNKAKMVKSQANLNQIGRANMLYQMDFGRGVKFADSLQQLYDERILVELDVFLSPGSNNIITDEFQTDYRYLFDNQLGPHKDTITTIVAYDLHFVDSEGKVIVLFLDGHTDQVPAERFRQMFDEQSKRLAELNIRCSYEDGITSR